MEWFKGRRTTSDMTQASIPASSKPPATDTDEQPQTQENAG